MLRTEKTGNTEVNQTSSMAEEKKESKQTTSPKFFSSKPESVFYVSYEKIFPGQVRFSSLNVARKVKEFKEQEKAIRDEAKATWKGAYHAGKSLFSEVEALPVLRAPFGYVLKDGHHDVLASIELKAEMVPIKVDEDLSHLTTEQFWKTAEEKGWAHLNKIDGQKSLPIKKFSDLIDDSNRYFASIIAMKITKKGKIKGAEYPIWVKRKKDIPFIEFKISEALYAKGFMYKPEMGNKPNSEIVEQAREILLQAQIPGLEVVPRRIPADKIKIDKKSLTISYEKKENEQRVTFRK